MFNELFTDLFQEAKSPKRMKDPAQLRAAEDAEREPKKSKEDLPEPTTAKIGKASDPQKIAKIKAKKEKDSIKGLKTKTPSEDIFNEPEVASLETSSATDLESIWKEKKAQYGAFYTKSRGSVADFLSDAAELPVLIRSSSCKDLIKVITGMIEENTRPLEASKTDPAFIELMTFLNQSTVGLNSRKSSDFSANMPGYVFLLSCVFPLLESDEVSKFFSNPNTIKFFTTLQNSYPGIIFNPIEFSPEVSFTEVTHIKDSKLKNFILALKRILTSPNEQDAKQKRLLAIGLATVAKAMNESTVRAIGNNRHKNEIAKTIYYSMLGSYAPFNLDLFELDSKKVKDNMNNQQGLASDDFLTDSSETLIAAKRILILQDPLFTRGTLGRNVRDALAFQYAKDSDKLKKQTALSKIRETEKINSSTIKFFNILIQDSPELSASFAELDDILSDFFSEKATSAKTDLSSMDSLYDTAFDKLHSFAVGGLDRFEAAVTNPTFLSKLFAKAIQKSPEITAELASETDKIDYVQRVYIDRFRTKLESIYKEFAAITKEDVAILLKVTVSIFLAKSQLLPAKDVKTILDNEYKKHMEDTGLTSNQYRWDGFSFLSSALKLPELLLDVQTLLRKSAKEPESLLPNKNKKDTNSAFNDFQRVKLARKRIRETEHLLLSMKPATAMLFKKISQAITNADLDTLRDLVFGIDENDESNEKLSEFLTSLIDNLAKEFFSDESHFKLNLLSSEDILDSKEKANHTIINDLLNKAKNKILATEGIFNANLNYYDGLTSDYMDFINLAASIKKDFTGLSINDKGEADLDFKLDATSDSNSFFSKFFFSGLPDSIEINPIIKLCYHKFVLLKLKLLVSPLLNNISVKDVLLPEVIRLNKEASGQIDDYFKSLYTDSTEGIQKAIDVINDSIVKNAGNTTQKFELYDQVSGKSIYTPYFIPGNIDSDFEKVTTILGNRAFFEVYSKSHNLKNASKLFFNSLSTSLSAENMSKQKNASEDLSAVAVSRIQSAIDIISTAINLKAFKCATLGNDDWEKLSADILNKYQKNGDTVKINEFAANKTKLNNVIDKFTRSVGFEGTQLVTSADNRISNPILAIILDKFNKFMTNETIKKIVQNVSAEQKEREAAGTADYSNISNVILPQTGIVYLRTVIEEKEPEVEESDDSNKEAETLSQESNGPKPLVHAGRSLKFSLTGFKQIKKELDSVISGEAHTTLGKNKRYGSNLVPIKSYSQYLKELSGAISVASDSYIQFYSGIGLPSLATEVKQAASVAVSNCSTMNSFFKTVTSKYLHNLETQQILLGTLQKLNTLGAITEQDASVPSTMEAPALSELFTLNTAKDKHNFDKLFNGYIGSKQIFLLLQRGFTLAQISDKVNKILLEKGNDPEFLEVAESEIEFDSKANKEEDFKSEVAPTPRYVEPVNTSIATHSTESTVASFYEDTPEGSKLKQEFIDQYCTIFDRNTYLTPNFTAKEKQAYKKTAESIFNIIQKTVGTPEGAKFKNDLWKAILTGKGHNNLLRTTVKRPATNPNQLPIIKESILQLASRLLSEADEKKTGKSKVVRPMTPEEAAAWEPTKVPKKSEEQLAAESDNERILASLAATLKLAHHVIASEQGLLKADGKTPFTFSFIELCTPILQATNESLAKSLKVIDKFVKRPDRIQFQIEVPGPDNMAYIPVFHFAKLKGIVDKYYKLNITK